MVGFSIKRFFEKNFSFFQKQQRIKDKKYQIRADIRAKKRQLSEAEKNEAAITLSGEILDHAHQDPGDERL